MVSSLLQLMLQFKAFLPAAVAAITMAACGGKIPPTQYYALHLPPAPAPAAANPLPKSVVVMPLRASEMLTQDRIVYRPSRHEVGYYEYHRWAEDPRTTLTAALIDSLVAKGAFERVVRFDGRTRGDYVLRTRIDRLEEVDYEQGVQVYAEISAELLDSDGMKPVWRDSASAGGEVRTPEVREVVERMSEAAARAVSDLAESLAAYLRSS